MLKRIAKVLRYTQLVALLLVSALGSLLVKTATDFEQVDKLVEHSHLVLTQLDQVRAHSLRASIGLRNYAIKPRAEVLAQTRRSAAATKAAATLVEDLTSNDSAQQARAQEMLGEVAENMGWLLSSAVIGERDGPQALQTVLVMRQNSDGARRLRETLDALEAGERTLLSDRRERRHSELAQIKRLALGAGLTFGIFIVWAIGYSSKLLRTGEATFEELSADALRDPLTGLLNRRGLAVNVASFTDSNMAVLAFDLDRFKPINDRLGHAAGDEVLRVVAERLRAQCRDLDLLARVGGDEFLVMLPDMDNQPQASRIAERIGQALNQPIALGDEKVVISASIGCAVLGVDGADFETLVRVADARSYAVKITKQSAQGRGPGPSALLA